MSVAEDAKAPLESSPEEKPDESQKKAQPEPKREETVQKVREQVEFYFSDANLPSDRFLREKLDANGMVPITLVMSFKRMKKLTTDQELVKEALAGSKILKINPDQKLVGRIAPLPPASQLRDKVAKCTVRAFNIPADSSVDSLKTLFSSCGVVRRVKIQHPEAIAVPKANKAKAAVSAKASEENTVAGSKPDDGSSGSGTTSASCNRGSDLTVTHAETTDAETGAAEKARDEGRGISSTAVPKAKTIRYADVEYETPAMAKEAIAKLTNENDWRSGLRVTALPRSGVPKKSGDDGSGKPKNIRKKAGVEAPGAPAGTAGKAKIKKSLVSSAADQVEAEAVVKGGVKTEGPASLVSQQTKLRAVSEGGQSILAFQALLGPGTGGGSGSESKIGPAPPTLNPEAPAFDFTSLAIGGASTAGTGGGVSATTASKEGTNGHKERSNSLGSLNPIAAPFDLTMAASGAQAAALDPNAAPFRIANAPGPRTKGVVRTLAGKHGFITFGKTKGSVIDFSVDDVREGHEVRAGDHVEFSTAAGGTGKNCAKVAVDIAVIPMEDVFHNPDLPAKTGGGKGKKPLSLSDQKSKEKAKEKVGDGVEMSRYRQASGPDGTRGFRLVRTLQS